MEEEEENEPTINQGFDRGIDYLEMKQKLIDEYNKQTDLLPNRPNDSQRRITSFRIIYLIIACIQLINGSRISEAVEAFRKFLVKGIEQKVVVKIAKSETTKYKKKKKITTKARYRKMGFPKNWIDITKIKFDSIKKYIIDLKNDRLQQRVLDYLLKYFNCNTHSLRYAFINYMLYTKKYDEKAVAKFVGHSNTLMLQKYTQLKNTDKIFDLDL